MESGRVGDGEWGEFRI